VNKIQTLQTTEKQINQAEFVKINGIQQFIYHQGSHYDNPVILHLHGGPGNPFSNKAYLLESWSPYFTMVYYDQRGAGKTAIRNPETKPSFQHMIEDIHELILYLKRKYNKAKIGILAHSWGTMIGSIYAQQFPEHLAFYIGVGQVIAPVQNEKKSYQEMIQRLYASKDEKRLKRLENLGRYPGETPAEFLRKMGTFRKLQVELGMCVDNKKKNLAWIKQSPLFSEEDLLAPQLSAQMLTELLEEIFYFDLVDSSPAYHIPIYYLLGKKDWQVPTCLAVEYFNQIKAPDKKLVVIDDAMHEPMLEKPDAFLQAMRDVVNRQGGEEEIVQD